MAFSITGTPKGKGNPLQEYSLVIILNGLWEQLYIHRFWTWRTENDRGRQCKATQVVIKRNSCITELETKK